MKGETSGMKNMGMAKRGAKLMIKKNVSKINLGCGKDIKEGFLNVDRVQFDGVDLVWDLNKTPYPFEDNSVDYIYCSNTLEHVIEKQEVLKECNRILKNDGVMEIIVPHKNSLAAYHITHLHFFSIYSFDQGALIHEFTSAEVGYWKVLENNLILLQRWGKNPFDKIINACSFSKLISDWLLPVQGIRARIKKIGKEEADRISEKIAKEVARLKIPSPESKEYCKITEIKKSVHS